MQVREEGLLTALKPHLLKMIVINSQLIATTGQYHLLLQRRFSRTDRVKSKRWKSISLRFSRRCKRRKATVEEAVLSKETTLLDLEENPRISCWNILTQSRNSPQPWRREGWRNSQWPTSTIILLLRQKPV